MGIEKLICKPTEHEYKLAGLGQGGMVFVLYCSRCGDAQYVSIKKPDEPK